MQCETLARGEVALARALLYRMGVQAFRYPGPGWLEEWDRLTRGVAAALEVLALDSPLGKELPEVFDRCWAASRDVERLCAEHARCIGPSPRAGVTPYETEWTGAAGELLQYHQLADLSGFYRAFGLDLAQPCDERVDHLAVELAFLQFLCVKEGLAEERGLADLLEVTREGQRTFLEEHLLRWAPACCRRFEGAAGFHGYAAEFVRRFLETERQRFSLVSRAESPALAESRLALEDCCVGCSQSACCAPPGASPAAALEGADAHG